MNKKTRYILHWIGQLSKIRPELGNFAICPYASNANFKILDEKLCKIVPKPDFDVVIYVVDRNYPDYKFIADHGKTKTYIQNIQTSNGKYNLVLCQPRKELTEARKKLAKTNYYEYWDESYLKEVLEDDFSEVIE